MVSVDVTVERASREAYAAGYDLFMPEGEDWRPWQAVAAATILRQRRALMLASERATVISSTPAGQIGAGASLRRHAETGRPALRRWPTSLSTSELGREGYHVHDLY
jgi:hypothetical protein